jgi:lipoyl(octanoyl) transferase
LEEWIIRTLRHFNVTGERRENRAGVWVVTNRGDAKIAAIGVRVRKWVTYHGFALNLDPDLSHYAGIVPCGISDSGVTSLRALGGTATMQALDEALVEEFGAVFGPFESRRAAHG